MGSTDYTKPNDFSTAGGKAQVKLYQGQLKLKLWSNPPLLPLSTLTLPPHVYQTSHLHDIHIFFLGHSFSRALFFTPLEIIKFVLPVSPLHTPLPAHFTAKAIQHKQNLAQQVGQTEGRST